MVWGRDIMLRALSSARQKSTASSILQPAVELIEITHPHLKLFVAASIGDGDDDESGND